MLRVLSALFTALAIAGGILAWAYYEFEKPGPLREATIIDIPKGSGLNEIAGILKNEGVLEHDWLFVAGVRLAEKGRGLKAGEYEIPPGISPREVMDLLLSGATVVHRITIVEGTTVQQAVERIQANEVLTGDIGELPAEGMLLPETYHFSRGETREALIARMQADLRETLDAMWATRDPSIPVKTPMEALILASIVEKETSIESERARIAAVFSNRLEKGMRLQADPTVVYGLSGGSGSIGRPLTRADLETPNPYNTYLNAGLPPGPIALPGKASIAAVMLPAETDDLYFVADGTGGHAFAKTLDEHNRNVLKWRKFQRQQTQ